MKISFDTGFFLGLFIAAVIRLIPAGVVILLGVFLADIVPPAFFFALGFIAALLGLNQLFKDVR